MSLHIGYTSRVCLCSHIGYNISVACVCVCLCVCVCVCTDVLPCKLASIYVCTCIYEVKRVRGLTNLHPHAPSNRIQRNRIYMCIHKHLYHIYVVYIHMYTYTCIYIYTYRVLGHALHTFSNVFILAALQQIYMRERARKK